MTSGSTPEMADAMEAPQLHLFAADQRDFALVVEGSRLYEIDAATRQALEASFAGETSSAAAHWLADITPAPGGPFDCTEVPESMPLRALSLAVAQKCNLGCQYCYADGGSFGAPARNMELETALAAVDRLIEGANAGDRVTLAFLGGEPLVNRPVIRTATRHAAKRAGNRDVRIGFSITTNGTLLRPEDGDFFEEHGFAVTISLDGIGKVHDRQRPYQSGRGSYERIIKNAAPLLAKQRKMQVSARATVTSENLDLLETLDTLLALGFHSVGFSPMLRAPSGKQEMTRLDLDDMCKRMIGCGKKCETELKAGRRYGFANLMMALQEIHKGTHRPYPCGAGAGYFGVSADGALAACHRFVGDDEGQFGDLERGIEPALQRAWLRERHVDKQAPCRTCWARYLCGGGCHHEVIARGRPACDYIRGWLHYCLQAYTRLQRARPDMFAVPAASSTCQSAANISPSA